jgi:putative protease
MSEEQPIGHVSHYFGNISVAAIELYGTVQVGDWVQFYGNSTNFSQQITSMQIDRAPVDEAYEGQSIGVQVADRVRVGDNVFLIPPPE